MPTSLNYDDLPVGVCIVKRDRKALTILRANATMAHMLSKTSAEDMTGSPLDDVWHGKNIDTLIKRLKSPTPPADALVGIAENNKNRWVVITIQESEHEGQEAFILWVTDISSSKAAEEKLQAAVEEADALASQKSNFLATMSHEIRTPMQSVYGLLELIEQEKPTEQIGEMVGTAKNSASGLLEILDDILDFAKMDADQMELDMFEVPVRTLARGINEALSVKVQGKDIQLLDDIDEKVPFVIVGDPKRLRQIIMNLMGNAIKFTQAGSVTIKITSDCRVINIPKNRLGLRFEIIDSGIGMPQEVCDRLFKPFSQADNSTSRKFGGTGLGLSICKKLVDIMGGEVGVSSLDGLGSTFWFEIPTQEVSTETNVLDMPNLEGLSVLSVEDHPQGAREIVKSLRSMGANIESCPTYTEGLELIKRRPFDVAIIDQGLPDGLGLDLIREAMDIRPFMGIIMYTVRDDAGLQHTLQSLGATYLTKPASRIGLGEAVRDAANRQVKNEIDGPQKLVIAEDTESVRDVLQRQLKALGVEATFVENGQKAIEAYDSSEYGILVTDLHMPEKDGYEVVKHIRDQEVDSDKHFPVIVLTADVQMAQRQVYFGHGFDECLLKPVSLGQFKRLLMRWGLLKDMDERETSNATQSSSPRSNTDEKPAIDKDAMISQMGAFDENAIEMLGMFVDMTAPLIEQLVRAHMDNDNHALKETAHSLKGAARSACANILGDICSDIQDFVESGKAVNDLPQQAAIEFERVKAEVAQHKD